MFLHFTEYVGSMIHQLLSIALAQLEPGAQIDAQIAALQAEVATLTASVAALEADEQIDGVYIATEWIPDGGDLADAIDAIQRDPGCSGWSDEGRYATGCEIVIPRGRYQTTTATVCRQVRIQGAGAGAGSSSATRISTSGQTAFYLAPGAYCETLGFSPPEAVGGGKASAGATTIEGLMLADTAGYWDAVTSSVAIYSAGIHAETRFAARDVYINGFTQGVRISADVTRAENVRAGWPFGAGSNANVWRLDQVHVQNSRHSGLYVDAGDANAGVSVGLDVNSNCQDGDVYEGFGFPTCANLHDSSLLGNTHIAPHSSLSRDRRGTSHHQYLIGDGGASDNVVVGAYAEIGAVNGVSTGSNNDVIVGGASTWSSTGTEMRLQRNGLNKVCTPGPLGGQLCLGQLAGGSMLAVTATVAPFATVNALRLKPVVTTEGLGVWRWDVANLGVARAIDVVAADGDGLNRGDLLLRGRAVLPQCRVPDPLELAGMGLEAAGDRLGVCEVP